MQKIKFNFSRFTDSDLETKAAYIVKCMDGNPNFEAPVPTVDDIKLALEKYSAALVSAADGSHQNVALKKECRRTLEMMLTQLAMYVMFVANGSDVVLTSSGFNLVKAKEPRIIDNPGAVILSNGKSTGELRARVKAVPGAVSYVHSITADPLTAQTQWATEASSRSQMLYSNLQQGTRYWVKVAAVGSDGQFTESPASSMYVQ